MMNKQYELNCNLAKILKDGVIMDVTTPDQATPAEAEKTSSALVKTGGMMPLNSFPAVKLRFGLNLVK